MIFLIFILFSLGSLGRISFFGQTINIYLYEIVYASYLIYLLIKYKLRPLRERSNIFKYIYIFLAAAAISFALSVLFFNQTQNTVASLYLLRLIFYLLGIPYVVHHFNEVKRRKSLVTAFLIYAAVTAFLSVAQYMYYPNLRNLEYLGWDPHQFRMFGSVFDTSTAAALYGVILLFLMFYGKKYISPVLWLGSIILYGAFGALTYSRGFYISITITLLYYLVIKNKRLMSAAYLVLIAAALIILIPKPTGESANLTRMFTIQARANDYQEGIKIFEKNPILGIGYNHLRAVKPGAGDIENNHAGASLTSSYLIILSTMGIIGLTTFALMIFKLSQTSQIALYTLLFLSLFSFSDNILLHPFILFIETFIFALGIENVADSKKKQKKKVTSRISR